jgi:2-polyprenyl-3-methyl-5-hydroxy-6-metoxy-1,4-benzoquinol methylase
MSVARRRWSGRPRRPSSARPSFIGTTICGGRADEGDDKRPPGRLNFGYKGAVSALLEHPDGRVIVTETASGRRRVSVQPARQSTFVARASCETSYPLKLVEQLLRIKGIGYLCDELSRDEDPQYVERYLRYAMLAYVPGEEFRGKRLLDFGCGAGASTMVLARLFPETEIVGVELRSDLLEIARMRARHRAVDGVSFLLSPSPDRLPDSLGTFDFVSFSAVYEHLLRVERAPLLAQIWGLLSRGGVLFIGQTPHRWFPHEYHTTGLPLVNYLPDRLALRVARRWSRRVDPAATWKELLRAGIRGGTEREVLSLLRALNDGPPVSLQPEAMGFDDRVDLWYAYSMAGPRPMRRKRAVRVASKVISRLVGEDFVPSLELAIRKT